MKFTIPPKKVETRFHRSSITVEYVPELNSWLWKAQYPIILNLSGYAKTMENALHDAKDRVELQEKAEKR